MLTGSTSFDTLFSGISQGNPSHRTTTPQQSESTKSRREHLDLPTSAQGGRQDPLGLPVHLVASLAAQLPVPLERAPRQDSRRDIDVKLFLWTTSLPTRFSKALCNRRYVFYCKIVCCPFIEAFFFLFSHESPVSYRLLSQSKNKSSPF